MTYQQVTLVVPLGPNVGGGDTDYTIRAARYSHRMKLAELENALCAQFGGWTATDGQGAWNEGSVVLREDVRVYTLAASIGLTSDDLAQLRHRVKVLLDQRAVYLAAYDLAEKPVQ